MSETDSCVAVLSRTSAILPHNRLARLAHSANGKGSFTDSLRRAVGGLDRQRKGKIPLFIPFWADNQPSNFFNPEQIEQFGKINMVFLRKNADEYRFFMLFSDHIKLLIF